MSVMDHSTLLTKLVIACERALQMRTEGERDPLFDLHEKLVAEYDAPVDGVRVINDEIVLCSTAILNADAELRRHDRRRSAIFLRVIGVLLPEVRIALAVALEQRKRPTP